MPNLDPYGAFIKDAGVWEPAAQPEVKDAGVWKPVKSIEVRNAGSWRKVWEQYITSTYRPTILYESSEAFGLTSDRAVDSSATTFWMSGGNASSESNTAYEAIRVNTGFQPPTTRFVSVTITCNAAYELYLGIRPFSGSWEGAILPNPTYTGVEGSEVQHAYAQGGDQTTATRTFSLGNRTDLAGAQLQFTATKLAVVSGYSDFRMAVKDIVLTIESLA